MGWNKGGLVTERKEGRENGDAKTVTHPQSSQMPQQSPNRGKFRKSLFPTLTVFVAEHATVWHRISLWSDQVSFPGCVPFQLFVQLNPQLCGGRMRSRGGCDPEEALLSSSS